MLLDTEKVVIIVLVKPKKTFRNFMICDQLLNCVSQSVYCVKNRANHTNQQICY